MAFALQWKRMLLSTAIITLIGGVHNTSAITHSANTIMQPTAIATLTANSSIDLDAISTGWARIAELFSCVNGSVQIVTTPSGVQYEDLLVYRGAEAVVGKTISVHYVGEFKNG